MKNSITIEMPHVWSKKTGNPIYNIYNSMLKEFKRKQIGYSAIAILGLSCMGSIAVMLLMMHEMPVEVKMTTVFLVTIFSTAYITTVLAQLKSKARFNALLLSAVFSSVVIVANLI